MENKIKKYTNQMFEDIKHIDEYENEYWSARELILILEYSNWQNFEKIINKSKISCSNSNIVVIDHFIDVSKMIELPKGATRKIKDYKLSRYACYLIAQNADPRKEVIALAQSYFAIQTRKQELSEKEYNELTEEEKRIFRRTQVKNGNYNLNKTAIKSGVKNLARFHNAGYKGLYNSETADVFLKEKNLDIEKTYLIIWVVKNLQIIYFVLLRQMLN